jgi:hypothetical protein
MRAIETKKFQATRRLQARYGKSRARPGRHVKNQGSPQPITFGVTSDGQTARRVTAIDFPRPIGVSLTKSAPIFLRDAGVAWNAARVPIKGSAAS